MTGLAGQRSDPVHPQLRVGVARQPFGLPLANVVHAPFISHQQQDAGGEAEPGDEFGVQGIGPEAGFG